MKKWSTQVLKLTTNVCFLCIFLWVSIFRGELSVTVCLFPEFFQNKSPNKIKNVSQNWFLDLRFLVNASLVWAFHDDHFLFPLNSLSLGDILEWAAVETSGHWPVSAVQMTVTRLTRSEWQRCSRAHMQRRRSADSPRYPPRPDVFTPGSWELGGHFTQLINPRAAASVGPQSQDGL